MSLYIGLMSGTSLDGIDAVLVDFDAKPLKVIAEAHLKFPDVLRETLLTITTSQQANLMDLGEIHTWLGECYATLVNDLVKKAGIEPQHIKAIGNHGQTVFHHPKTPHPFTMQLGNHSVVAAQTGIPVVGDFRSLDMAYGGQGAPLAPIFHQAFLADSKERIAIVNIGGIANATILEGQELIAAFDTGPGNALIDAIVQSQFNETYDEDGKLARQGSINEPLLKVLLQDAYFKATPPKSTGKEYFNWQWLEQCLNSSLAPYSGTSVQESPSATDLLATLTELTAQTISDALTPFKIASIWICGGGAFNTFLMERLTTLNPEPKVASVATKGIDPQWVEPLAFAYLAKLRIENQRLDLSRITGSNTPLLLGQIFYP